MQFLSFFPRKHPSINAIDEKMKKHGNPTYGFDFTLYEKQ